MKRTKRIIRAVAVVLLTISAVCMFGCQKEKAPQQPIQVFSCMPSDIVRYVVNSDHENYVLVKEKDVWELADNHIAVLKQDEVIKIVNGASMLTAQRELTHEDLQAFEKNLPVTVEIHLADGSVSTFGFTGVKGAYCAMTDKLTGKVYEVSLSVRDTLVVPLDRFRELRVFEDLAEAEMALTSFNYTDYEGNKTVIRQKSAYEISRNSLNRYTMERPYRRDVDDESFEQQIAVKIPRIAVAKYVDDFPEDLSVYGLDKKSRAVLDFTWANKAYKLYLGKNENGLVYATKADSDSILQINASGLEFLEVDPFFVLDKRVLEAEPQHIRTISARKDGKTYNLRCTAPGLETALYYINGKDASRFAFEKSTKALGEIRIINALLSVPAQKNVIQVDITYDNHSGTQRLKFVPINDKEYALFINNTAEFAVDKSAVDSLFAELEATSNNPMQTGEKG